VDVTTGVSSTSNNQQLTVVFDTGYSLPQVPSDVAKAFYESVPGAELVNIAQLDGPIWQIPCDYEINVTFKFGGVSYPINPLDTSLDLNGTDNNGNPVCYGGVRLVISFPYTFVHDGSIVSTHRCRKEPVVRYDLRNGISPKRLHAD